jgi:Putative beta-barrel porin-2, OmpL-like. bbp2
MIVRTHQPVRCLMLVSALILVWGRITFAQSPPNPSTMESRSEDLPLLPPELLLPSELPLSTGSLAFRRVQFPASETPGQTPSQATATSALPLNAAAPGPGGPTKPRATETTPTVAEQVAAPHGPSFEAGFLQKALGIQDKPWRIYGWIENSFTGNTNGTPRDRANFGVFPNDLANQWQGNQLPYMIVENPLEMDDMINLGFRVDFLFGNDWQYSKAYGLFDNAFLKNHLAGIDLPQFFGELHLPIFTPDGFDIRGGRFYDPAGFESVQAIKRPLLSTAYTFSFTPFTYAGTMTTLHVTPRLNIVNGAVEGADRIFDELFHYSYLGGFNWTSASAKTTLMSYVLCGPNQLPTFPPLNSQFLPVGVQQSPPGLEGRDNPLYAHHPRTYFDVVATHNWTDKLTHAAELFFVVNPKVPFPDRTVKDTTWYGFTNWFLYTFDEAQKYTGVWRAEIFNDPQGAATGVAGLYDEMTIGLIYKPKPWLWLRPEARYDWAPYSKPYSDGTRSSQFTLSFDIIVLF